MKHTWLAYVVVALLALAVGVGIAGLPSAAPDIAVPAPPSTGGSATSAPADDQSADSTSAPITSTTASPTTTTTTTTPTTTTPTTTTSTTSPSTASTSTTSTSTTTTAPLFERQQLAVVAVNGANVAGLAGRTTDVLVDLGYTQTRWTDGQIISETTLIYFADGWFAEARRLADDLEILDPQLLLLDDDAPFNLLDGDQVAVYVGLDRA